jgi:hypothetical protein
MVIRMIILAYILKASKSTDKIDCPVPCLLGKNLIFFGSCKKRIRERFYKDYLINSKTGRVSINDEIYILGFNSSNEEHERKIVWFGKLNEVFTYEKAWEVVKSQNRSEKILEMSECPLNLYPIYDDKNQKKFIGYELYGTLHDDEEKYWITDVVPKKYSPLRGNLYTEEIYKDGKKRIILKKQEEREKIFLRDCCFTCKKIFIVGGGVKGIEIDKDILKIFKEAQPKETGVDDYYVFGQDFGKDNIYRAKGRRGSYLEISDNLAEELCDILRKKK